MYISGEGYGTGEIENKIKVKKYRKEDDIRMKTGLEVQHFGRSFLDVLFGGDYKNLSVI